MHRHLVTALAILAVAGASAQSTEREPLTAAKCFTVAPTSVFDMLDANTRLDMLDYYHAGVQRASTNSMDGECLVLAESPHALTLRGGNGTVYQLFLLNPDGIPVIGVIETLDTPVPDSSVKFYTTRWQEIDHMLASPTLSDWLRPGSSKQAAEAACELPFIMASYAYDPDTRTLTMTNNMDQYYHHADRPAALEMLRDSLQYRWDGKKFKPVKQ